MVDKSLVGGLWPQMFEPFRNFGTRVADWVAPAAEASANGNTYRIAVELPGVEDNDIELSVDNGMITVKGEKKTSHEEKGETWYFSERAYGSFSRSFRLPADADEAKVKADMKDGVLTITVSKSEPQKGGSTKKIAIGKG